MSSIYCIGTEEQKNALASWFPLEISCWSEELKPELLSRSDVVFALAPLSGAEKSLLFAQGREKLIFLDAVLVPLLEHLDQAQDVPVFGVNGHPFFLGKPPLEVSYLVAPERVESWLRNHHIDYVLIKDEVGMVRLRVLAMIINEAYWMLTEGHAEPEEMDTALKLGTNYPYGPFEWAKIIGETFIFQVLNKLGKALGNETYKIAPELRRRCINTL